MNKEDQSALERSKDGLELAPGSSLKTLFNIIANEAHDVGFENACAYKDKLIAELKEKLEIKTAVIERWENEFDHMASQEFCEEIESISEGGADFRTASEMKAENGWTGDADENS